jgi:hypothetical protein
VGLPTEGVEVTKVQVHLIPDHDECVVVLTGHRTTVLHLIGPEIQALQTQLRKGQPATTNMGAHALAELKRVGMFNDDADYGPEFAACVAATVETFGSLYGHSGGSAELGLDLVSRLIHRETL